MNKQEALCFLSGLALGLTTAGNEETIALWLRIAREFHVTYEEIQTIQQDAIKVVTQ
jgi:hypothetical protein